MKFLTLAILSFILMLQHSPAQTSTLRDLSLYDQAGPYDAQGGLDEYHKMKSEVRAFIWSRWREKRRGRVIVTLYTREGDPSINTFFIEPNAHGQWQVVCEYMGTIYPRWGSKSPPEQIKGKGTYDVVERRAFEKDSPYMRRVPDDEVLDAAKYELWLEDSKSKDQKRKDFLTL